MVNANAQAVLAKMQKKFGDDQVMMANQVRVGDAISTGSIGLDFATGFGGLPSNRVVEIYGKEGTGKTTLSLLTMANALRRYPDSLGLILDTEHKMTTDWLIELVGEEFATKRIIYTQPKHIEDASNVYRHAMDNGNFSCAILDSIGGSPTVRTNEDAEVGGFGGNSKGVSEFANLVKTYASINNCLTIGINQVRAVIGSRIPGLTDTPGGKAWRHACVLRVELVRGSETETITLPGEDKPVPIGYNIYARVKKNQVGPEGRAAMYWFYHTPTDEYDFGVDYLDEIARLGIKTRTFTQKGGWYHHPLFPVDAKGEHKVNGIKALKIMVKSDEKLRDLLTKEILAAARDHAAEVAPMTNNEEEISPFLLNGGME